MKNVIHVLAAVTVLAVFAWAALLYLGGHAFNAVFVIGLFWLLRGSRSLLG